MCERRGSSSNLPMNVFICEQKHCLRLSTPHSIQLVQILFNFEAFFGSRNPRIVLHSMQNLKMQLNFIRVTCNSADIRMPHVPTYWVPYAVRQWNCWKRRMQHILARMTRLQRQHFMENNNGKLQFHYAMNFRRGKWFGWCWLYADSNAIALHSNSQRERLFSGSRNLSLVK